MKFILELIELPASEKACVRACSSWERAGPSTSYLGQVRVGLGRCYCGFAWSDRRAAHVASQGETDTERARPWARVWMRQGETETEEARPRARVWMRVTPHVVREPREVSTLNEPDWSSCTEKLCMRERFSAYVSQPAPSWRV